ncbi:MAG: STAS/SEC14 domain-containing protein [Leptolyngbyaceae cyanobacterium]
MIELLEMSSDRVIGVKIDGKIEKTDIQEIEQAFVAQFEQFDKVAIYVEVANLGGITLDALIEDLKFGLSNLKRFEKKAVVSEHHWMDKLAPLGDKLFPSLAVKHFTVAEKDAAIAWVSEPREETVPS